LREFENQLFEIKTKYEITVTHLREYIEEWLKKDLIKINQPENQEAVIVVMPPQPQHTPRNLLQASKGYEYFPLQ
jgi:hypothetical protein